METRRRRITIDIMIGGFKHNKSIGDFAENQQYYPILDSSPMAWAKDGWRALDHSLIEALDLEK
jgi:hypothetical protein